MNRWNVTGLIIVGFITVIAIFGPLLAPFDLEHHVTPGFVTDGAGEQQYVAPPLPPDRTYWFGTDVFGYDILTLMMHGAKYTLAAAFIVALFRVVVGAGLGMIWGYYRKGKQRARTEGNLLSGIPMFVVVLFMMYGLSINSTLSPLTLTVLLGVVLVLLGLPAIISSTANKTRQIQEQQYVLASVALGAGDMRTLRYHILPQMKESLLILFLHELILTLTVFGQLGIFHIFVGGTLMQRDPVLFTSLTHEWAGMVGNAKGAIGPRDWIFLYPMLGYVTLIFGFFCVSKGMEQSFRNRYHKVSQL
ncbi:hypothetical protein SY83_07875 [Paenibacillus swuensis]|uniref:ABC transmembrane type-1 domain-containing protein n=1 Tax=Paenibacillus swuensis TaxID=1178515 RepID=A0A172TGV8_9BACL|nr:ABC transporter permease subunit [Paenibacillus swuensis]ANE46202.1 hypothetical protein SY83_07875 [Paenibacillus swuensis]